jgi:hypothetical protein
MRQLWEGFVDGDRPESSRSGKVPMTGVPPVEERSTFPWPWGLVAVGVMALAWVGIYLLWNGITFLFT